MALDLNRFIATFFDEAQEHLESIEERAMAMGSGRADPEVLNAMFRAAHSIKGGSGTFGFAQLTDATHELETLLDNLRRGQGLVDENVVRLLLDACDVFKGHLARLKGGDRGHDGTMDAIRAHLVGFRATQASGGAAPRVAPAKPEAEDFFASPAPPPPASGGSAYGLFDEEPAPAAKPAAEKYGLFEAAPGTEPAEQNRRRGDASSIRVSVEKIDRIVNLVGELVIAQAMMQQAVGVRQEQHEDEHLAHSLATLDRNTRDLQQAVMSIRMLPMEFVFSRFPRLVYDVSSKLGKRVHLRTLGHETELDKELIELLVDPLTHVVRNAIDHGIEPPEERVRAGKPETGTVGLRATHRGGSVILEVTDDGRGLDRGRILAKARELGLPLDENASDEALYAVIFEPGFSTAREVTAVSGRGVGMDVVRRNITSLGGTVNVASKRGQGTTITLQVPLTLAVLDGMIVGVGPEQYIVPIEFVAEAFMPGAADIRRVVGQPSLVAVRGEHLPIVRLEDAVAFDRAAAAAAEPLCLVVEVDNRRAALLVDTLIGQQQLVVKSLESNLHGVPGVAGATILGDGRVALILDVSALVRAGTARLARDAA